MTDTTHRLTDGRRHTLQRRIRWIVGATIAYNLVEATVAITAGSIASSAALIGFGLDSVIEVLSAAAVAWQPPTSPSPRCSLSPGRSGWSILRSVSSSPR